MDFVLAGFLIVVAFVVTAFVVAIERSPSEVRAERGPIMRHPRLAAGGWLLISAAPTLAGMMAPVGPIPAPVLFVPVVLGSFWLGFSRFGGDIANAVPIFLLTGFQGFRLPLELVLHEWADAGVAPPQMTWTGANVDIIAGIVALATLPIVRRWPRAGWIPTVAGMVLLANVLRVVVISVPGPLRAYDDPLLLPALFPHVWIATVCVAGAVVAHVIAVRALLSLSD
jgi:hypothetical protein